MKVAVVAAAGLGDGLLSMILAHNLLKTYPHLTVVSSPLYELRSWFPQHHIVPLPRLAEREAFFSSFDELIVSDHAGISPSDDFGNKLYVLQEKTFDRTQTMVVNFCHYLKQRGVSHDPFNGISPPHGLQWKRYPHRVLIHPESSHPSKNWPAQKFVRLAITLRTLGWDPVFCVSPTERGRWLSIVGSLPLPLFPHLTDLATFVYESGFLIGNDSGLGHLASCLHIDTLSLFARKSYARLWRPGWSNNRVVTPPPLVPGARLKQHLWKHLLGVNRVLSAFQSTRGRL